MHVCNQEMSKAATYSCAFTHSHFDVRPNLGIGIHLLFSSHTQTFREKEKQGDSYPIHVASQDQHSKLQSLCYLSGQVLGNMFVGMCLMMEKGFGGSIVWCICICLCS